MLERRIRSRIVRYVLLGFPSDHATDESRDIFDTIVDTVTDGQHVESITNEMENYVINTKEKFVIQKIKNPVIQISCLTSCYRSMNVLGFCDMHRSISFTGWKRHTWTSALPEVVKSNDLDLWSLSRTMNFNHFFGDHFASSIIRRKPRSNIIFYRRVKWKGTSTESNPSEEKRGRELI